MIPDQDDNSAPAAAPPLADPSALEPEALTHSRPDDGFWVELIRNLRCGLRLAFFRPVPLDRLSVRAEQLIALAIIDLAMAFAFDFISVGLPGRLNPWGLPGALFYLPLTLLTGYATARIARNPQLALALPIALLSAVQYVSLLAIALFPVSGALEVDLSHRAVYFAFYWGPFLWWIAIACFVIVSLVPGRLAVKLASLAITAILVLLPGWLLPRSSMGALWVGIEDEPGHERLETLASEEAFYAQPELLRRALSALAPGTPNRSHLYFVGVAGFADEDVFEKELKVISGLMQQRFDTADRSISLINNPATVLNTPLASRTSLARTLSRVGQIMNRDDDVLFLYLTSHGSEDHRFALSFSPLHLRDLDPSSLRQMLDTARIRWRVVVVSACYSGGFIDALKSDRTLVITAADAQHTSFGCGAESDFTYFGKAYFDQALRRQTSFIAAFDEARRLIKARERSEGKTPSNPQIYVGAAMQQKLHDLEAQLPNQK